MSNKPVNDFTYVYSKWVGTSKDPAKASYDHSELQALALLGFTIMGSDSGFWNTPAKVPLNSTRVYRVKVPIGYIHNV